MLSFIAPNQLQPSPDIGFSFSIIGANLQSEMEAEIRRSSGNLVTTTEAVISMCSVRAITMQAITNYAGHNYAGHNYPGHNYASHNAASLSIAMARVALP